MVSEEKIEAVIFKFMNHSHVSAGQAAAEIAGMIEKDRLARAGEHQVSFEKIKGLIEKWDKNKGFSSDELARQIIASFAEDRTLSQEHEECKKALWKTRGEVEDLHKAADQYGKDFGSVKNDNAILRGQRDDAQKEADCLNEKLKNADAKWRMLNQNLETQVTNLIEMNRKQAVTIGNLESGLPQAHTAHVMGYLGDAIQNKPAVGTMPWPGWVYAARRAVEFCLYRGYDPFGQPAVHEEVRRAAAEEKFERIVGPTLQGSHFEETAPLNWEEFEQARDLPAPKRKPDEERLSAEPLACKTPTDGQLKDYLRTKGLGEITDEEPLRPGPRGDIQDSEFKLEFTIHDLAERPTDAGPLSFQTDDIQFYCWHPATNGDRIPWAGKMPKEND